VHPVLKVSSTRAAEQGAEQVLRVQGRLLEQEGLDSEMWLEKPQRVEQLGF